MSDNTIKVKLVDGLAVCAAGIDSLVASSGAWRMTKEGAFFIQTPQELAPSVCLGCGAVRQPNGEMPCDH